MSRQSSPAQPRSCGRSRRSSAISRQHFLHATAPAHLSGALDSLGRFLVVSKRLGGGRRAARGVNGTAANGHVSTDQQLLGDESTVELTDTEELVLGDEAP